METLYTNVPRSARHINLVNPNVCSVIDDIQEYRDEDDIIHPVANSSTLVEEQTSSSRIQTIQDCVPQNNKGINTIAAVKLI